VAYLCDSDGLVKKLEEMEKTAGNYRQLMDHARRLLRAFFNLSQAHRGTRWLLADLLRLHGEFIQIDLAKGSSHHRLDCK